MTEPRVAENSPSEPEATRWMRRLDDDDPDAEDGAVAESDEVAPLAAGTLLTLSLLWLAATLWSAHAEMAGNLALPSVVLSSAALALPVTVAATLLAGAASGLAAVGRFAPAGSRGRRAAMGAAAGAVCGTLAAVAILVAYGGGWAVGTLAITIGVAGAVGGTAALAPPPALAAGVAATLGVFVTGVVLALFHPQLTKLYGAGDTVASHVSAERAYFYTASIASGLVAGLVAYLFLRRRGPELRWPAYLFSGLFAGLLALVGEVLTRIGGARLLGLVGGLSDEDRWSLMYAGNGRIIGALVVGFVGAIVAMVLFGRTLKAPE